MAFSSGVYTLPGAALATGDTVSATDHNQVRNDMATAFNLTWLRNGTAAATDDIPMGGFSLTNAAAIGSATSLLLKSNNGTTAVTIDTAQNVGVGVTPSAWNGAIAVEVGAVGLSLFNATGSANTSLGANVYYAQPNYKYATTAAATLYQQLGGVHYWFNAGSGTAGNTISLTQAMTLDASGKLLVGNTSSIGSALLQSLATNATTVSSTYAWNQEDKGIVLRNNSDTTNTAVGLTLFGGSGGNSSAAMLMVQETGNSLGALAFYTGGAGRSNTVPERARIDSSGNLLVNRTTATDRVTAASAQATQNTYGAISTDDQTGGGFFVCRNSSGTFIGGVLRNGASAVSYATSSDYRLKEITGPLTDAKEFIMALRPKQGTWKEDGSRFVGFVAHEFQEVSPSSVNGEKDDVDEQGNPKYQSMQASSPEVMANVISLLQEQQALITTLTERITALEAK